MEKVLKKGIAFIMVLVYLFTPTFVMAKEIQTNIIEVEEKNQNEVLVNEIEHQKEETKENQISQKKTEEKETKEVNKIEENKKIVSIEKEEELAKNTATNNYGNLQIEFILRLPVKQLNIQLSLSKEGKNVGEPVFSQKEDKAYYSYTTLEAGIYELTIEGVNYITYRQTIEINNNTTNLKISNTHEINDAQPESQKYGVIGYGDITGDGAINQEDELAMIKKIETGEYYANYDLNGDGKLDILDLTYLVYNEKENILAIPIRTLNTEMITVEESENTVIEQGAIENILKEGKDPVRIAPKNKEAISANNPVEVTLELAENTQKTEGITIRSANEENAIKNGTILIFYEDENGQEQSMEVPIIPASFRSRTVLRSAKTAATAIIESDGTIVINLNGQVAIKKVTIKITQTVSNKLADIAKVEFLNDMENRIPPPTMDIPRNLQAVAGNKEFSVSWQAVPNITGYEVSITSNGKEEKVKTITNHLKVTSFSNNKIKNGTEFVVKVQSLNGDWKSGFSEAITVIPITNKVPDAPENITITGVYRALNLSWKQMEDTDSYTIYYREKGQQIYQKTEEITSNRYTLSNLKDKTEYEIYLVGHNEIGQSKPSSIYVGTTIALEPTKTPNYKLINTSNGDHEVTAHIKDVILTKGWESATNGKFSIVDNNYASYWEAKDWDCGAYYAQKAPIIQLDARYEMNQIILVVPDNYQYSYHTFKLNYWDENGNKVQASGLSYVRKTDENGKQYYIVKTTQPFKTDKVQLMVATYGSVSPIQYTELKFYYYDSLEDDINGLYKDELHVELKEEVTEQMLEELQNRLDTKDEVSGEYHPSRELLQKELDNAKQIFSDQLKQEVLKINTSISSKYDTHLSMSGGLNAWQPLGITAHENETIVVYVGSNGKKVGDNVPLTMYATQFHAESGVWYQSLGSLKVGRNEMTIPRISSMATEHGGSLYIEYTGNNKKENYGVRVSGGSTIPVLNISGITDEQIKKEKVREYVEKLETYVPTLEELHNQNHGNGQLGWNYQYDEKNCINNMTEILMDKMMYSVSAKQILTPLKGTTSEKAEQLYQSLTAMDKMLDLFYQHKGLSNQPEAGAKNQIPSKHLNIRYHRMFAGAFMYAGGLHIGIEWGSIPGLVTSIPVQSTEQGKYESGNYFGWGIAHEIGHIINEGAYAVAEITNNYFSVLAQAKDTNQSVRFQYPEVYKKVTSGTKGRDSSVFTQLGLYWQLHLAYDKGGYNYKTFDHYTEQFNNLFFARVDSYARDISKAPSPNGIKLTLTGDTDNKLMRLAVAAANKNLLEFFQRWGMTPDQTTIAYATQFEKETRPIYYVSDDARAYELAGGKSIAKETKVVASLQKQKNEKRVKISLGTDQENIEGLLGYEIKRNGNPVAFVTADQTEYVDTIETANNRVVTYEITGVDKLLNQTNTLSLEPIKISHDGSISKQNWTIETNLTSEQDKVTDESAGTCTEQTISAINTIINHDDTDNYIGTTTNQKGEIIFSLNEVLPIVGLKYKAGEGTPIKGYEIYVSQDQSNWEKVKKGSFDLDKNREQTIYFNKENDSWLYTYDASYVKLVITKQAEVSISEIDLLGPAGDNIELLENGIGKLKANYQYGLEADQYIPAGSILFTGEYKGNPAYNVVKLLDQDHNIVSGQQIILAKVPEQGELGEISSGTWIYWITPEEMEKQEIPTQVKAELYRVDDAHTNEGERLVSDTLMKTLPSQLPDIEIKAQ